MDKITINKFDGEYRFLSNFYICKVHYDGLDYTSAEAAFQSAKCLDYLERKPFTKLNPVTARTVGKKVNLRPDWDEVKEDIMYKIVRTKFYRNDDLAQKLLLTEDALLIEGNTWGDTFWGMYGGVGQNKLGEILMKVREELNVNA